ncbi:MAG: hypothetical protein WD851_02910 [Pirellulales bacterium]
MNERTSYYRKIAYGVAIAALLFPLSLLSSPATVTDRGGQLAQMREQYDLGQGDIGEIDPASETIKLATLGLRGVAVNLLWEKANYYKKTEDWTNLTATLEQLAKLQPNFVTFWMFQSWNLSYNVSVEFDDYRDRYYYVREGIEFLQKGERYNRDNFKILKELGWFIGQKIGRADEYVQYRRLFKNDEQFHPADRTLEERDNWLVGKEWYLKSLDAAITKGKGIGRTSPKIAHAAPAKSQMSYAEAIEEEGFFEKAQQAWALAETEWLEFGELVIDHSTGVKLQLNHQPQLEKEVERLKAALEELGPGIREKIAAEKRDKLPEELRATLDAPADQRTPRQNELLYEAEAAVAVSHAEVAQRLAQENPERSRQSRQLASELDDTERKLSYTINYKRDSNFDYWLTRTQFEQTADALDARELMFRAKQAYQDEADPQKAKELYERGFQHWRKVFDAFPTLLSDDGNTPDDVLYFVKDYREALDQLDETIPADFPLWVLIEQFDTERSFAEELQEHQERQGKIPEGDTPEAETPADGTTPADEPTSAEPPQEDEAPVEPPAEVTPPAEETQPQPE